MTNIIKKIILVLFLLNSALASDSIKITLIERISQFIEWPNLNDEFAIGVYKNEELKNQMIETYKNKTIQKLPIKVYNIQNNEDLFLDKLNLIYFTNEISTDIDKVLKKIDKSSILTITEFPNDIYQGMHIGLYYENQRIKFMINQKALEDINLKASYKILKLAKIVKVEE